MEHESKIAFVFFLITIIIFMGEGILCLGNKISVTVLKVCLEAVVFLEQLR